MTNSKSKTKQRVLVTFILALSLLFSLIFFSYQHFKNSVSQIPDQIQNVENKKSLELKIFNRKRSDSEIAGFYYAYWEEPDTIFTHVKNYNEYKKNLGSEHKKLYSSEKIYSYNVRDKRLKIIPNNEYFHQTNIENIKKIGSRRIFYQIYEKFRCRQVYQI